MSDSLSVEEVIAKISSQIGLLVTFQVTDYMLSSSMFNATAPIVEFFESIGFHDFENQEFGQTHKLIANAILLEDDAQHITSVSMYRTNGGERRMWVRGLNHLATGGDTIAMIWNGKKLFVLNCSKTNNLNFLDALTKRRIDALNRPAENNNVGANSFKSQFQLDLPTGYDVLASLEEYVPKEPKQAQQGTGAKSRRRREKIDYIGEAKKNQLVGTAGEEFVLLYERKRLEDIPDLADKIEHVSLRDDSLGYDIRSFERDGKERLIEVKTTTNDVDAPFFISSNELETANRYKENYLIYRVFNIKESPKLVIVKSPFEMLELEPVNYRVFFKPVVA